MKTEPHINITDFFIGLLMIFIFLITMEFAFQDEEDARRDYCEKVARRIWPDYRKIVQEECESKADKFEQGKD